MIHCVNVYNANDSGRQARARASWDRIAHAVSNYHPAYLDDSVLASYGYTRNGRSVVGAEKASPFWKDVISCGFAMYPYDGLLMFTNADSVLATDTLDVILGAYQNALAPLMYSHRGNFHRQLTHPLSASDIEHRMNVDDLLPENSIVNPVGLTVFKGIDLLVIPRWWWEENKDFVPDLLIGFQGWDYFVRALGPEGTKEAQDCGRVLVAHEMHGEPFWKRFPDSVGNKWNWLQLYKWYRLTHFTERQDGWVPLPDDWRVISP